MSKLYKESDYERVLLEQLKTEDYRGPFRKDYGRLVHCANFRRLQGKTQLFPSDDFDFFRNRLTHSVEVAQIAHCIALKLNRESALFAGGNAINTDLVEFAALAHDIGHPPFGHNGEKTLNDLMARYGGFEGNAQTLRIVSCLSRKHVGDHLTGEPRKSFGLNLTKRALASVIKRNHLIPTNLPEEKHDPNGGAARQVHARRAGEKSYAVDKGYYQEESQLVDMIWDAVVGTDKKAPSRENKEYRTIECSIMDVADDIAYSVYDLEDAFKAGFLSPLDLTMANKDIERRLETAVNKAMVKEGMGERTTDDMMLKILPLVAMAGDLPIKDHKPWIVQLASAVDLFKTWARNGVFRTAFTSQLIGRFVSQVQVRTSPISIAFSQAYLPEETRLEVEVLKNLTYILSISSHRLRIAKARGQEIVRTIFQSIEQTPELLPDDFLAHYQQCGGTENQKEQRCKRVICDFISGMTDRYAAEFYARLGSEEHRPIFTPM